MSVAATRYAKALLDVLYPARAEMGREQLMKFAAVLTQQAEGASCSGESHRLDGKTKGTPEQDRRCASPGCTDSELSRPADRAKPARPAG